MTVRAEGDPWQWNAENQAADSGRVVLSAAGDSTYSAEHIREDVRERLSEAGLETADIEVSVAETEVFLHGRVPSEEEYGRAATIAADVVGVTGVHNHLLVEATGRTEVSIADHDDREAEQIKVPAAASK